MKSFLRHVEAGDGLAHHLDVEPLRPQVLVQVPRVTKYRRSQLVQVPRVTKYRRSQLVQVPRVTKYRSSQLVQVPRVQSTGVVSWYRSLGYRVQT